MAAEYKVPKQTIQQHLARVSNIVGREDEDTHEKTLTIPGLSISDFNRTGVVDGWSISKLPELSRLMSFKTKGAFIFLPSSNEYIDDDTQVVVLAQTINVSPLFHQRARLVFPLVLRVRLVHVGTSSFSLDIDVIDKEFSDVLIATRRTFAAMDTRTGQAKSLPESLRLRMMKNVFQQRNTKQSILEDLPSRPPGCFSQSVQARHSDTDNLYHVNQASYIKFCIDAATEATKLGRFSVLKGDLLSYRIKSIECVYKGESLPGDVLTVFVWQDERYPDQLLSQIENCDKIIWMGRIGLRLPLESIVAAKL